MDEKRLNKNWGKSRALVVMDTENLIMSSLQIYNEKPKFHELDEWLHEKYNVIDKIGFVRRSRTNGIQNILYRLGWTIYNVNTKIIDEENQEQQSIKNALDIELALSTYDIILNNKLEQLILISGDGDYLPLIKRLKKLGIVIDVISIDECTSAKLIKFSDNYFIYAQIVQEIESQDGINGEDKSLDKVEVDPQIKSDFENIVNFIQDYLKDKQSEVNAGTLKAEILKKFSNFEEKQFGFEKFRDFLIGVEKLGCIKLLHDKNQTWVKSVSTQNNFERSASKPVVLP